MAGHACQENDQIKLQQCSYPARFGAWLRCRHGLDDTKFELLNRGRGGVTTSAALPMLPSLVQIFRDDATYQLADWLIVDFSANDIAFPGSKSTNITLNPVAAATEIMLRFLLAKYPRLPLLFVQSSCSVSAAGSSRAHEAITSRYGVPFVAFADALKPNVGCTPPAWELAGRTHHPTWRTHASIASMMAQWWPPFIASFQASRASSPLVEEDQHGLGTPLTSTAARAPFVICREPITSYDAHALATAVHPSGVKSDGWSLYEDRPSKPGWITDVFGASIEFNLTFGAAPRLLLVYEAGYEGWGKVNLHIGQRTAKKRGATSIPVLAQRTEGENVTQAEMLSLDVGIDTEGGKNNHHILPFETKTLKLVFASQPPLKFKVLLVSSC